MRKLVLGCLTLIVLSGCAQTEPLTAPPAVRKERATGGAAKQADGKELSTRIDQLLKQLASSEFKEREEAADALQKLLDSKSGEVLGLLQQGHATTEDPEVKERLRQILEPYAAWHITPKILQAIPDIVELLDEDTRSSMRTAVEVLRKLNITYTRSLLFSLVLSGKYGRRRALEALIEKADTEVIKSFTNLLSARRDDYDFSKVAVWALKRIAEKSVAQLVKSLQETEDAKLRESLVKILTGIPGKGHGALIEALATEKPSVKLAALGDIIRSRTVKLPLEVLVELLKDKDPGIRAGAARLLHTVKCEKAFQLALSALEKDSDAVVRAEAVLALGDMCDKRAVPILIEVLKDTDKRVRYAAAQALGDIRDKRAIRPLVKAVNDFDLDVVEAAVWELGCFGEAAIPEMLKAFKTATRLGRINLAEEFGHSGDRRAVPVLLQALKDKDCVVRSVVADALGELKAGEAVPGLIAVLKDSDTDVRTSAVYALGEIGDKQAVEALTESLKESNSEVRMDAAYALGQIGDKGAVTALMAALSDNDDSVCEYAARALGRIRDKRAVPALAKVLKDDEGFVNNAATEALAAIGGERALEALVNAFTSEEWPADELLPDFGEKAVKPLLEKAKSGDPFVRGMAYRALAMLREEKAFDLMLAAIKDKKEDWSLRTDAISAIPLYRDTRAVEPLAKLLNDDELGWWAARALAKFKDRRAVEPLIEMLLKSTNFHSDAARALGEIGDKRAIESLITALLEDYGVPQAAAEALASFRGKHVVEGLAKALEDNDREVRRAAADSLAKIGDKRAATALIANYEKFPGTHIIRALRELRCSDTVEFFASLAAGDRNNDKQEAAFALGETGDRRAIEPLRKLLEHSKLWVRMAAAVALLRFDDRKATELLHNAFKGEDQVLRVNAVCALSESPHPKALPWLVETLKHKDKNMRREAASALAKLGDHRAADIFVGLLKDRDEDVREEAIEGLVRVRAKSGVAPLIEVLATDLSDGVRNAAHDALHEITGQNFGWNWQRWRRWLEEKK